MVNNQGTQERDFEKVHSTISINKTIPGWGGQRLGKEVSKVRKRGRKGKKNIRLGEGKKGVYGTQLKGRRPFVSPLL